MRVAPLPRVSGLSALDVNRGYIERGIPVVIDDACRHWPAVAKWNTKFLLETVGDIVVPIRDNNFPAKGEAKRKTVVTHCTLQEYLAGLSTAKPGDPYLSEQPLKTLFPQLVVDVGSVCYPRDAPPDFSIMLSSRSYAPLHFHAASEAVSHQVTGTRRFLLIAPSETRELIPMPAMDPRFNFATRLITEDQIESLEMECFEATLSPGQAIFIPVHWWHSVYAGHGLSILLADFFPSPPARWKSNPNADRVRSRQQLLQQGIELFIQALRDSTNSEERVLSCQKIADMASQLVDPDARRQMVDTALRYVRCSNDRIEERLVEILSPV